MDRLGPHVRRVKKKARNDLPHAARVCATRSLRSPPRPSPQPRSSAPRRRAPHRAPPSRMSHHPAASQPGPRSAAPALRAHPSTCALGASDGHTHLPQERGGGRTDHVHRTTAKGSRTHRTTANGSHTPRTTAIANDSEPTTAKCSCAKQTPKRGHTRRASQCTPRETRGKCIVICQ